MLKISEIVCQSVANMSGCGKQSDYSCGMTIKMG